VTVHEPLAPVDCATEKQRKLATLTSDIVTAFQAKCFAECVAAIERAVQTLGPSKLFDIYHDAATEYLAHPPQADFDGRIKLPEK